MSKIKEIRELNGISKIDMCKMLHMSETSYSKKECNIEDMKFGDIIKICNFLNCSIDDIYSCNEDIAGRDIKIVHNGQEYIVSLMVQTKRSLFFKKRKNEIRHQYGDNEIQIKLDLKKAKTIGDFYVYDKSHIATLIRTIKAT